MSMRTMGLGNRRQTLNGAASAVALAGSLLLGACSGGDSEAERAAASSEAGGPAPAVVATAEPTGVATREATRVQIPSPATQPSAAQTQSQTQGTQTGPGLGVMEIPFKLPDEHSAYEIEQMVFTHLQNLASETGGFLHVTDDETGEHVHLQPVQVYHGVRRPQENVYISRAELAVVGTEDARYHIDFWIEHVGKNLKVSRQKIAAHPRLQGTVWVSEARYTFTVAEAPFIE